MLEAHRTMIVVSLRATLPLCLLLGLSLSSNASETPPVGRARTVLRGSAGQSEKEDT